MTALTMPAPRALPAPPPPIRESAGGEARIGALLAGGLAGTLLLTGLLVPLDAAVIAPGVVKVAGERQKVQAASDGVVEALAVREGEQVRAGQTLVRLGTSDARAAERALATRVIGLQAEIARLETEIAGGSALTAPAGFADYAGEDRTLADRAMVIERARLAALLRANGAEAAILRQRVSEIGVQIAGAGERRQSLEAQRALLAQELHGIETLAAKGYASRNRVLQLKRNDEDMAGSISAMQAEAARLRENAGEVRLQLANARVERLQRSTDRLAQARTELAALQPQWAAAREALKRTELRAPAAGTVVGLNAHTVGGFLPRGATVLEIVPQDRSLEVEARLAITDANSVHAGDVVRLRMAALHGRRVPMIEGRVSSVSADSLADERTGQSFYRVAVKVSRSEIDRLRGTAEGAVPIRPGNPVSVTIPIRSRSALVYWLEPLWQSMTSSLHEM